ncbi:MAG: sulfotransferase [Rhodocyclaceae bacterium]|nr:sulfotransferase [Rhodocyclaceae bacterium]
MTTHNYAHFSVEGLLQMARDATGLSDFGPDSFRPGLEHLVAAINELPLTEMGLIRTRNSVLGALIGRLGVWHHRQTHPEVAAEEIKQPLFVIGLPRTGTTLLIGLLGQDPENRVPLMWEVSIPCPPPEAVTYDTDPRIAMVTAGLEAVDGLNPEVMAIHPVGAQLPQECIGFIAQECLSYIFYAMLPIKGYNDWVEAQDQSAAYRWHKTFLQHLQSRHRKQRWALKAPSHMNFMADLFETYPDAVILNTHRDPVDAVTSHCSLHWKLWQQALGSCDKQMAGEQITEMIDNWLRRYLDWRDANPRMDSQIHDIDYSELVADPIATVKRIYRRIGLKVSPAFERGMQQFLADNRQDKFGRHRYTPEEFGLTKAQLASRYRRYRERFCVAKP